MQLFIVGSPLETAMVLDPKRLRKQIVECGQILNALNGVKAWSNHPCVLQYRGYEKWVQYYTSCLECYKRGLIRASDAWSSLAMSMRPDWHTQEYYDQMKRRLYTKDPEHYKQWADLGFSDENWYWSQAENKFIKYINGKRI